MIRAEHLVAVLLFGLCGYMLASTAGAIFLGNPAWVSIAGALIGAAFALKFVRVAVDAPPRRWRSPMRYAVPRAALERLVFRICRLAGVAVLIVAPFQAWTAFKHEPVLIADLGAAVAMAFLGVVALILPRIHRRFS